MLQKIALHEGHYYCHSQLVYVNALVLGPSSNQILLLQHSQSLILSPVVCLIPILDVDLIPVLWRAVQGVLPVDAVGGLALAERHPHLMY